MAPSRPTHGCHGLQVPELCSARCVSLAHLPRDAHFVRAPEKSGVASRKFQDFSSIRRQHFKFVSKYERVELFGFSWNLRCTKKKDKTEFAQHFPASSFPAIGNELLRPVKLRQTRSDQQTSKSWNQWLGLRPTNIFRKPWFPLFPFNSGQFHNISKPMMFFWCFTQCPESRSKRDGACWKFQRQRGSTCNPLPATLQQHAQEASRMCIPVMRCYTHVYIYL